MSDSSRQRLAAILAADAAGYSRLMTQDETATMAALDAARAVFRSEIELHHGRVIDMAGDSVLAVFETATGAVRAALSVGAAVGMLGLAAFPRQNTAVAMRSVTATVIQRGQELGSGGRAGRAVVRRAAGAAR